MKYFSALLICVLLSACASPTMRLTEFASSKGFDRSLISADGFELLTFANRAPDRQNSLARDPGVLRVYLEGDGSPWKHRTIVMPDPTPRSPLMLQLMSLDNERAVYLGRPCYNGTSAEPECNSSLWTSARYSETVVRSMASGLRALANRYQPAEIWLFGHSGGGALAMLLAARVPAVNRVVTIAGNLDTDAWTSHHHYTPLYSSLNPAKVEPLPAQISQWHFVGGVDTVVPPQLTQAMIHKQPAARGFQVPSFGHGCCWSRVWSDILQALEEDAPQNMPGQQFKYSSVVKSASDSL